ncbi:MAG: 16S rRNA (cytidine(1402)-2'-O)-methyltransferase [Acidobacteriota bacterium]|nr:16S rRNA (cytidine(1402)-2'-O)-methyltransferase [Acidobacteriota bacterium]
MPGTLYLVATPIGNLQDISFRALETLKNVDVIACEDTRHTRKLLNFYSITNKLISYHEHNESERAEEFAQRLQLGESIAIVSDAGTPGINDPGFRMVQKAHEIGAAVVPVPGAAAFVNAAIASGLPIDSLFFGGFLPSRKGERRKRLAEVKAVPATLIFYESPHRLCKSLTDCLEILGNRQAAVARELTKLHEEIVRGNLRELSVKYLSAISKGEIVLVIERSGEGASGVKDERSLNERVKEIEAEGNNHMTALKKAAKEFGLSKSEAYRIFQGQYYMR